VSPVVEANLGIGYSSAAPSELWTSHSPSGLDQHSDEATRHLGKKHSQSLPSTPRPPSAHRIEAEIILDRINSDDLAFPVNRSVLLRTTEFSSSHGVARARHLVEKSDVKVGQKIPQFSDREKFQRTALQNCAEARSGPRQLLFTPFSPTPTPTDPDNILSKNWPERKWSDSPLLEVFDEDLL